MWVQFGQKNCDIFLFVLKRATQLGHRAKEPARDGSLFLIKSMGVATVPRAISMRAFVTAFVAAFIAGQAMAASETNRAELILQETKAAMGGHAWDGIRIWHERGTIQMPDGTSNSYDSYYDFMAHRFHDAMSAKGATRLTVFDGNGFSFFTNSKLDRTDTSSKMKMVGLQGAYMNSYGFFFPDRFAATVQFKGVERDRDSAFDVVQVTPSGLSPIDVWIDERSHLVDRYVANDQTTRLKDYRRFNGLLVPFVAESSGVTIATRSIELQPENPDLFEAKQH